MKINDLNTITDGIEVIISNSDGLARKANLSDLLAFTEESSELNKLRDIMGLGGISNFSTGSTYPSGLSVYYRPTVNDPYKLYRCISTKSSGPWDASKFEEYTFVSDTVFNYLETYNPSVSHLPGESFISSLPYKDGREVVKIEGKTSPWNQLNPSPQGEKESDYSTDGVTITQGVVKPNYKATIKEIKGYTLMWRQQIPDGGTSVLPEGKITIGGKYQYNYTTYNRPYLVFNPTDTAAEGVIEGVTVAAGWSVIRVGTEQDVAFAAGWKLIDLLLAFGTVKGHELGSKTTADVAEAMGYVATESGKTAFDAWQAHTEQFEADMAYSAQTVIRNGRWDGLRSVGKDGDGNAFDFTRSIEQIRRQYFPQGMNGINIGTDSEVCDTIEAGQVVRSFKCVKIKDIGTWRVKKWGVRDCLCVKSPIDYNNVQAYTNAHICTEEYIAINADTLYQKGYTGFIASNYTSKEFYIADERYTTADSFLAAHGEDLLFYELATPIITPLTELNLTYPVSNTDGTETPRVESGVQSSPIVLDVQYNFLNHRETSRIITSCPSPLPTEPYNSLGISRSIAPTEGHEYLIRMDIKGPCTVTVGDTTEEVSSSWKTLYTLATAPTGVTILGSRFQFKNFTIHDLTLMDITKEEFIYNYPDKTDYSPGEDIPYSLPKEWLNVPVTYTEGDGEVTTTLGYIFQEGLSTGDYIEKEELKSGDTTYSLTKPLSLTYDYTHYDPQITSIYKEGEERTVVTTEEAIDKLVDNKETVRSYSITPTGTSLGFNGLLRASCLQGKSQLVEGSIVSIPLTLTLTTSEGKKEVLSLPIPLRSVGGICDTITYKGTVQRVGSRPAIEEDLSDTTVLTDLKEDLSNLSSSTTLYPLPQPIFHPYKLAFSIDSKYLLNSDNLVRLATTLSSSAPFAINLFFIESKPIIKGPQWSRPQKVRKYSLEFDLAYTEGLHGGAEGLIAVYKDGHREVSTTPSLYQFGANNNDVVEIYGSTYSNIRQFRGLSALINANIQFLNSTIPMETFCNCLQLKKVRIPQHINTIETNAFIQTTALEKVDISDLKLWCEMNIHSMHANPLVNGKATLYLNGSPLVGIIYIPEGTESINSRVFLSYNQANEYDFPTTLKKIHTGAFDTNYKGETDVSKCTTIQEVNLAGTGITNIKGLADKLSLTKVTMEEPTKLSITNCSLLNLTDLSLDSLGEITQE